MSGWSSALRSKDLWAGLLFAAFGAALLILSQGYEMGSVRRMGPAYFPALLALVLLALGGAIVIKAVLAVNLEPIGGLKLRPLAFVLLAALGFAVSVNTLGLPAAVVIAVTLSTLAQEHVDIGEALISAIVLAVGSAVVFIWGLGLPFKLWPG